MILQYKATIAESKKFCRVYEVKGDMTLFKFNNFITNDMGFAPDQIVVFEGWCEGKLCGEYGLFDMGDGAMDSVSFEDLCKNGQTEIHYVFDVRGDRWLVLTLIGEVPEEAGKPYPYLVSEAGPLISQFDKYVEVEEEPASTRKKPKKNAIPDIDDEDFDDDDFEDEEEDEEDENSIYDGEEGQEIYGEE